MSLPATSPSNGFRLPAQPKTYDLKKLRGRHHLIIRLAAQGHNNKDIADALGVTPVTITYTLQSQLAQQKMAVLQGMADVGTIDVIQEIREIAPIALEQLEDTLRNSGDERLKVAVAKDILDRAGFGATQKIHNEHELRITQTDIDEIKRRAREQALSAGFVSEATILDETENG